MDQEWQYVIHTVTFQAALDSYPKIWLDNNFAYGLGLCCLTVAMVLVLSSYWRLGFFGTFYGDYFGLLMEGGLVTSFPYTVTDNPMYWGCVINYAGVALHSGSTIGFALVLPLLVYRTTIFVEEPFIAMLYSAKKQK